MKNTWLLLLVTSLVLGCGANKKNERGAEDKITVQTKADDKPGPGQERPVVPTNVNLKNEKGGEAPRK